MNDPTATDPSAEPRSIGGSDSTAMPVCPFVGRRNDPALVEAMPDSEHRCYKPPSAHRIRSDIQGRFCLSARYQRCPVYRGVVAHPPGPSLSERIFGGGLLELIRSPMGLAFIFFAMLIPAAIGVGYAVLDDDDEPADAQSAVAGADADADAQADAADADAGAEAPASPAGDGDDDGAQAAAQATPPAAAEQTTAEESGGGQQATAQAAAEEQSAGDQSAGDQATDAPAAEEQADAPEQPAAEPDPDLTPRERLFNWTDLLEHVVESGDSLGAIAAVYGTTVEALAVFNGIADVNAITIGQVIAVPVGFTEDLDFVPAAPAAAVVEEAPPAAEDDGADTGDAGETDDSGDTDDTGETDDTTDDTADAEPEPESDAVPTANDSLLAWTDVIEWTVQPGDTLFLISQDFVTTVDAIAALNGIDPAVPILIGQVLRVPRGFLESLE